MKIRFLVLNGPNLNMLGKRDPKIYGLKTLEDVIRMLRMEARNLCCKIVDRQSNHEGELIDIIQRAHTYAKGIIFNPGGLAHTSVVIREAVEIARDLGVPTVEVHISNIDERESFRRVSMLSHPEGSVVLRRVSGLGVEGYISALQILDSHIRMRDLKLSRT